jgi:hypothetical protein
MECKTQKWKKKNALRKLQRSRDPNHPVLAKEYIKTKTSYKALIRQKQDAYDALMVSKLHKANHPDGLWRAVEYFCPSFTLPNIIPKNTWFQHFKRVFSNTSSRTLSAPGLPTTLDPILDRDINPFEITLATKQLKAGKSAGPDLLPNEIWKLRTPHLMLYLLSLFQLILDTGKLPVMWCMARITPIHKKGPLDDPKNYRPISILSTALKLFTKILNERLKEWVASQNKISDFQAGFRKRRSCADHIFTLMSMIQIQLLQNQELYVVFVDLSQAFDTPDHNLLWSVLLRMGVSQKFLSSLQFLYESASAVVSTAFGPTEPIKIMKGVLQGESASPTLFNLFIEELVNKFLNSLYRGFKIGQRLVHLLLYADDLAIVAQSKELLQEKIKLAAKFLISRGLKVNLSKTKVVIFRRTGRIRKTDRFTWMDDPIDTVPSYTYLGVPFQSNGTFSHAAENAVAKGLTAQGAVLRILRNLARMDMIPIKTLLNAIIKSTTLYCAGIWGINHTEELEIVQQRFLKRVIHLPISTPKYFVRLETDVPALEYDVFKGAWSIFTKLLNSEESQLALNAYKELRKVSTLYPDPKYSWCLQFRSLLAHIGLEGVYDRQQRGEVIAIRNHALAKYREFLKSRDLKQAEDSKTIPHYFPSIKARKEIEPFLKNQLPVSVVTTILQVRLNSNAVFSQGRWHNVGHFVDVPCKLCGDRLSFYHLTWECWGTLGTRKKYFTPTPRDTDAIYQLDSPLFTTADFPHHLKRMIAEILSRYSAPE